MRWAPELPPRRDAPQTEVIEWLMRSFDKLSIWSDGVAQKSDLYGALEYLYRIRNNNDPPATTAIAPRELRLNNATHSSATTIWISIFDESGIDITGRLELLKPQDRLYIEDPVNNQVWYDFEIQTVTNQTTYFEFGVSYKDGNGAITPVAAGYPTVVTLLYLNLTQGYGGLSLDEPIASSAVISPTPLKITGFASGLVTAPKFVTQDVSNSRLIVDAPGIWVGEIGVDYRVQSSSANTSRTVVIDLYNERDAVVLQRPVYSTIPRYGEAVSVVGSAMLELDESMVGAPISLRAYTLGSSVTLTAIDGLEFSFERIDTL